MKLTIDHIIFIVRDLPHSIEHYKLLLGRKPSWEGRHPSFNTKNALFRLDNTYIELLAEEQCNNENQSLTFVGEHLLRCGQGLAGVSFGTNNATELVKHMNNHGVSALGPMPGEGADSLTGTVRQWMNVFWPNSAARGLWTFGIQHLDSSEILPMAPELVPSDEAANAVDHLVIRTNNAQAARQFYGQVLGIRLAAEVQNSPLGHLQFFKTSDMVLEVASSNKKENQEEGEDKFFGITYRTADIEAAQSRLLAYGVKVSEVRKGMRPGTKVCTVKSHNLDVPTLLIEFDK